MSYTEETTFYTQLIRFGIGRLLGSRDAQFAAVIFFLFAVDNFLGNRIFEINKDVVPQIIAIAASIFAVIVTALAIIISFSQDGFGNFLRHSKIGERILFTYWLSAGCFVVILLGSLFYSTIKSSLTSLRYFILTANLSLLVYALINTLYLLASTIRFGYFLLRFGDKLK